MVIHDTRLPEQVERGVEGGPRFDTVVNISDGGIPDTNQNWTYPLFFGNVSYGIQSREDFEDVLAFFRARRGRMYGFLFKDWSDYIIEDQLLGTGDGSTVLFQTIKSYPDDILPFTRRITRPVESTMTISVNGSPISSSAWSLDALGVIHLNSAPGVGQGVRVVYGEFDIPVMFDTDQFLVVMQSFEAGEIPRLGIREVRE
jgi:uncharacterized protein (TIGR02217 family)